MAKSCSSLANKGRIQEPQSQTIPFRKILSVEAEEEDNDEEKEEDNDDEDENEEEEEEEDARMRATQFNCISHQRFPLTRSPPIVSHKSIPRKKIISTTVSSRWRIHLILLGGSLIATE